MVKLTNIARRANDTADKAVSLLVRAYFTKSSLILHAAVYAFFWFREGGDHHIFLDGISIEAVFVALLVGVSTKTIIKHNHHLHDLLHEIKGHVKPKTRQRRAKPSDG